MRQASYSGLPARFALPVCRLVPSTVAMVYQIIQLLTFFAIERCIEAVEGRANCLKHFQANHDTFLGQCQTRRGGCLVVRPGFIQS